MKAELPSVFDGIDICDTNDQGYQDQYWIDKEAGKSVITLHHRYPPTDENMFCIYPFNHKVAILPLEQEI